MPQGEQPERKHRLLGQVVDSIVAFGVLAFVIVEVFMYWLIGAPDWSLWIAVVVIAAFSLALGFSAVEDADDEEPVVAHGWQFNKPDGFWDWVVRFIRIWFGLGGALFFVELLLDDVLHAPQSVQLTAGLLMLVLVLWVEIFEPPDEEDSPSGLASEALAEHPSEV